MPQHTVASFDQDLKKLSGLVNDMGTLVSAQLGRTLAAMRQRDVAMAESVIAGDTQIDTQCAEIESLVISYIAKRQPVAIDLREIISTLKISTDLERAGDLAKSTAKRLITIGGDAKLSGVAASFSTLGERVEEQLVNVLAAYANRDDKLALDVWSGDVDIDMLHTSLFRELLTYMMEDPRHIGYCAHLMFCAKNLERIGDHATNIAESVHYIISGQLISAERPKGQSDSGI